MDKEQIREWLAHPVAELFRQELQDWAGGLADSLAGSEFFRANSVEQTALGATAMAFRRQGMLDAMEVFDKLAEDEEDVDESVEQEPGDPEATETG